jgi:hypothetical protein
MRYNVSITEPDWKEDLKARFEDRVCFILTDCDFTVHNQECEALAKVHDYFYSFDREFGYAFFTPKNRQPLEAGLSLAAAGSYR